MYKTNRQGGFIGIVIGIIIALAIVGGGYAAVKSVAKHKAETQANATTSADVSLQANGATVTSDGVSAGVNAGGVQVNTNGTAASVTFHGSNGASVTTNANASVSAKNSASVGTVAITAINPSTASIGQTITIHGSGFSKSGNTIKAVYGLSGTIGGISSTDGTSISLTIPQYVKTGPVSVQIQPGTYVVSVINASGVESNSVTFTITK